MVSSSLSVKESAEGTGRLKICTEIAGKTGIRSQPISLLKPTTSKFCSLTRWPLSWEPRYDTKRIGTFYSSFPLKVRPTGGSPWQDHSNLPRFCFAQGINCITVIKMKYRFNLRSSKHAQTDATLHDVRTTQASGTADKGHENSGNVASCRLFVHKIWTAGKCNFLVYVTQSIKIMQNPYFLRPFSLFFVAFTLTRLDKETGLLTV